ncbi:hypothetical protein GCM10028821_02820 [Hymenobacter jeollabukensis]
MLTAATALAVGACESAPTYPDEPSIEFKNIRAERDTPANGGTPSNRIFITIGYKDGNGDLGLSAADKDTPPFNSSTSDYRFNYHVKLYWYNTNYLRFEEYVYPNPALTYNGTFARMLEETAKPQPIRGDLTYEPGKGDGFPINYPEFRPGNRVKFDIYIYDRALHKSNVITTEELVLP